MSESESKVSQSPIDKFLLELGEMKNALPHFYLFLGAMVVWMLHFHFLGNSARGYVDTGSLFGWLSWVYQDPDSEYGMYVPFIVLFLVYWKRDAWVPLEKRIWLPAMALIFLGAVMHYGGYLIQLSRVSFLGFLAGLYGIIGLFFGFRFMKEIFFPFFLLLFCMPLPADLDGLTLPLRVLVSSMAVWFSDTILGIDVIRQGTILVSSDGEFTYDVAPACSGIRSLTSLFLLTTVFAFTGRIPLWQRLTVILSAIPLAIFGNWLRLTSVIVVAEAWGQEAGKKIEQNLGFLTFAVALVGVMLLLWAFEGPRQKKNPDSDDPQDPDSGEEESNQPDAKEAQKANGDAPTVGESGKSGELPADAKPEKGPAPDQ